MRNQSLQLLEEKYQQLVLEKRKRKRKSRYRGYGFGFYGGYGNNYGDYGGDGGGDGGGGGESVNPNIKENENSLKDEPSDKSKEYKRIKLPYELDALVPYIDEKTMDLHYNKHYKAYVDKLNELVNQKLDLEQLILNLKGQNDKVRFNAGGAYNHQIFWQMLSPEKTSPQGPILELINKKYSSVNQFKEKFLEKATTIMGSGWGWLVIKDNKLDILTTPNQDNPLMDNLGTPLLGIDMWEHAFYLKHGPDKKQYGMDFFKVINWNYCNEILNQTK
jgi:Fe-Mn family superoxide dismutase